MNCETVIRAFISIDQFKKKSDWNTDKNRQLLLCNQWVLYNMLCIFETSLYRLGKTNTALKHLYIDLERSIQRVIYIII